MDLFDKRAPTSDADGEGYGSSGEMKKTQYMLQLLGTPWDPDTLKCILAAAEQGMELKSGYLDTLADEQDSEEYRELFEFGTYPSLKESDYTLAGVTGILAFINARGLGYSLTPKNITVAAVQDFWIDVAITEATPNIQALVQEKVVNQLKDPNCAVDMLVCAAAKENLVPILDALDKQIGDDPYIIGKYSFADIHWTALIHLLLLTGEGADLVQQRSQINRWYSSLATRKSNSGQSIVSFSLLPSLEDIKNKKLSYVVIDDF